MNSIFFEKNQASSKFRTLKSTKMKIRWKKHCPGTQYRSMFHVILSRFIVEDQSGEFFSFPLWKWTILHVSIMIFWKKYSILKDARNKNSVYSRFFNYILILIDFYFETHVRSARNFNESSIAHQFSMKKRIFNTGNDIFVMGFSRETT